MAIVSFIRPTVLDQKSAIPLSSEAPDSPDATPTTGIVEDNLQGYIRACFDEARAFRQREGINDALLDALRSVRGEYDNRTEAEIEKFGGSKIYARIAANKVRGIAAMLREIYTASDRPWALSPTSNPDLPSGTLDAAVHAELMAEVSELVNAGGQPDPMMVLKRREAIRNQILEARQKLAADAARTREDMLDEYLQVGGFYDAFWDFLLDLATFPFAVLKGPTVKYRNKLKWDNGKPTVATEPSLEWERCSPFDVFFAPWSRRPNNGYILHYQRTTRADLQALKGLPSYNVNELNAVLNADPDEFKEWLEYVETERANLEDRLPDNWYSTSHAVDRPYPMIEFHGPVSTKLLREWGMSEKQAPTNGPDVNIVAYLIGKHVIGVRVNPHPLGKSPFYVDSYERVPGSLYGLGIPGLIKDMQAAGNAALRALVNNLAVSSGPQVAINSDRLPEESTDLKVWPWKVWAFTESLLGNANQAVPIEFFQPDSNANELLTVFQQFLDMADSFSSMPRFLQGDATGVATLGRSASGMSMMMNAANRTIKQVVISIDNTILRPVIQDLNVYVTLLKPDSGNDGDIDVIARGASELVEREALRQRRLEFLQITANPEDSQLVGPGGRFEILREIAHDLQLPTDKVFAGATSASARAAAQASQGPPQPQQGAPQQPPKPQGPPGPPNATAGMMQSPTVRGAMPT